MSGHNKWSSIKHRKGAQDAKRSKVFTKVIKEITVAARLGGAELDSNPRLRTAVIWARSVNMPSDNVKNAIKKGTGAGAGNNYENIMYEGYGPNNVAVIVECLTDNRNRTISSVRSIFNKYHGNIGATNSVMYMFDHVGQIDVEKSNIDEDTITEYILEAGAEDIDVDDQEVFTVTTTVPNLHTVQNYLEQHDVTIKKAELDYIPQNEIVIDNLDKAKQVLKFIDALEDDDDVQKVYSNFDISEQILEQLNNEA